jgi:PPOX class probable F420-dependent enzyme
MNADRNRLLVCMSAISLPDTVKQYIDDAKLFVTVATIGRDGHPHLTVTWIDRDGDELLYSTTTDRVQGKNLARDPRISVLIAPPDNPYVYAEIRGTATLTRQAVRRVQSGLGGRRPPGGGADHADQDHREAVTRGRRGQAAWASSWACWARATSSAV